MLLQPLRRALKLMGAPNLVPETLDTGLSYTVGNYLRKIKNQAKVEYERLCAEIGAKAKTGPVPSAPDAIRVLPRSPFKQALLSHPCLAGEGRAGRTFTSMEWGFASLGMLVWLCHCYPIDIHVAVAARLCNFHSLKNLRAGNFIEI